MMHSELRRTTNASPVCSIQSSFASPPCVLLSIKSFYLIFLVFSRNKILLLDLQKRSALRESSADKFCCDIRYNDSESRFSMLLPTKHSLQHGLISVLHLCRTEQLWLIKRNF